MKKKEKNIQNKKYIKQKWIGSTQAKKNLVEVL